MPKNTRRITVTRTKTFTTTIDVPGYTVADSDATLLTVLGGAAGNTGTLSLGELLAGSNLANNGTVTWGGNWTVSGTTSSVEPYITRPANTALTVGTRVASVSPPVGYEAALGKLYVVTVAGTTGASATEPNWQLTAGNTLTDGTVTYRAISKFTTISAWTASTARTLGQIWKPSAGSVREYLVTTAGTAGAAAPTWTNADTAGQTLVDSTTTYTALTNVVTYAFDTQYNLGDIVKPTSASTEEYVCTIAGKSDTTSLTTACAVAATAARGGATFYRYV